MKIDTSKVQVISEYEPPNMVPRPFGVGMVQESGGCDVIIELRGEVKVEPEAGEDYVSVPELSGILEHVSIVFGDVNLTVLDFTVTRVEGEGKKLFLKVTEWEEA